MRNERLHHQQEVQQLPRPLVPELLRLHVVASAIIALETILGSVIGVMRGTALLDMSEYTKFTINPIA